MHTVKSWFMLDYSAWLPSKFVCLPPETEGFSLELGVIIVGLTLELASL